MRVWLRRVREVDPGDVQPELGRPGGMRRGAVRSGGLRGRHSYACAGYGCAVETDREDVWDRVESVVASSGGAWVGRLGLAAK